MRFGVGDGGCEMEHIMRERYSEEREAATFWENNRKVNNIGRSINIFGRKIIRENVFGTDVFGEEIGRSTKLESQ